MNLVACTFGCKDKKEIVDPKEELPDTVVVVIPDTVEIEVPPGKTIIDVRSLRITSKFYDLVSGTTTYTSPLTISNWFTDDIKIPNYGRLLKDGDEIQMIAIGGGLTAGAQNGGLYRDGQLTAYPNLVARQLGMAGFNTPAFEPEYMNGTGFDLKGKDLSLKRVTNNLGTLKEEIDGYPPVFSSYKRRVHNFSTPWLHTLDIFDSTWDPSMIGKVVRGNGVSWPNFLPYIARMIPVEHFSGSTLWEYIWDNQPYNFFILEDVNEVFLYAIRTSEKREIGLSDLIGDIQTGENYPFKAMRALSQKGQKGVVFTVPYFKDMGVASMEFPLPLLNEKERAEYKIAVTITNKHMKEWAAQFDLALVDLNSLYAQINQGIYKTEQDITISGGKSGNFFSSDGLYPTILGQAVIANEVCKAINQQYQSDVPLVDIIAYCSSIGYQITQ